MGKLIVPGRPAEKGVLPKYTNVIRSGTHIIFGAFYKKVGKSSFFMTSIIWYIFLIPNQGDVHSKTCFWKQHTGGGDRGGWLGKPEENRKTGANNIQPQTHT